MTVSTIIVRKIYSGDGSATTFAYPFKIFATGDLQVIIRSSTGTETTKTIDTDYTLTGVGNTSGGNVVFQSGKIPTNTETVVLIRNVPQTQAIDYIANDPFPAETHEEGLDRATMTIQQVQEKVDRSIKISRTNTMNSTEFTVGATARASKVLGFDASGELTVTQELGTNRGNWSSSTAYNARDIVKDTSTNNIFLVNTAHTSSGSQPLTTNANASKYDLLVDAASATASAAAAVVAKDLSVTAKNESVAAKDLSVTAKNDSVTAKNSSVSAKDDSVTAKNAAQAAFASFDNRYLGAKSSNPSTDNSGNALITGALYFNSSTSQIFNWTSGDAWEAIKPTSTEQGKINTVAADATDIGTVAGKSNEIGRLGTSAAVADLAILGTTAVVADMAILGTSDVVTDMNVLGTSDVVTDMNVLGTSGNVTAMNTLGTSTNVTNMATVAANVAGVNSFAERYRVASSDPTSSLNEGDLAFNTQDNNLKFYNGTSWVSIAPGIANVVDDSTPQLGGNLDTNQKQINTVSNRNILLAPNGTGVVEVRGNNNGGTIQLNCEQNTHGVKIKSPPHSASQNYTLTLPPSITNGYYLKTDGSGNLAFAAVPVETKPIVSSVSPSTVTNNATNITITGQNFVAGATVEIIATTGAIITPSTVSFTNTTTIVANVTISTDAQFFIRVENPDGNAGRSSNAILTTSDAPTFNTAAGSLGSVAGNFSGTIFSLSASGDTVVFSEVSSPLVLTGGATKANCSLSNSGVISTSDFGGNSTTPTTYNFTIRITDGQGQTADRSYSLTSSFGSTGGGQFN